MDTTDHADATALRRRPEPYLSTAHGAIYYTPRLSDRRPRAPADPTFPTPQIQPRQRRPHSIHIVSYPPGFVPHELRQKPTPRPPPGEHDDPNIHAKAFGRAQRRRAKAAEKARRRVEEKAKREKNEKRRSVQSLSVQSLSMLKDGRSRVLEKILAVFSTSQPTVNPKTSTLSRPVSLVERPTLHVDTMVDAFGPLPATGRASSIISTMSAKNMISSSAVEMPKPVASGSGVSCSIVLQEPDVFLTGFDHDGHTRHESHNSSALLRGKLRLNVSKKVKIRSVTLKFVGKARTEWPEGIPPTKVNLYEEQTLRMQTLLFFHAMHEGIWETDYGNQCTYSLKTPPTEGHDSNTSLHLTPWSRQAGNLSAKELKRLSLQSVQSRSFGKGDSRLPNQVQARGYKVFGPGVYEYSFELPVDHHQLETIRVQYGSVRWTLEAVVERAGAFKPNLQGTREVSMVRVPDQMSLETSEPISISRQWEDQLHYDIVISGKSFPIGAKIPIAFKLTPLAKVQVHKLKVFVTESVEYFTNDRRVTRKDQGRKILLLEKTAGKAVDRQWRSSDVRVLAGGELAPSQRVEARREATVRRQDNARRTGDMAAPLPEPSDNMLGDLDLGLESYWGSTEMEMNVQMPTCATMAADRSLRLHPDCSWKNVHVYHWIKIVMRISRADPDDVTGKRRRHFEISIDSPFTVLNCRATQANTLLPQYGQDAPSTGQRSSASCGCPDAATHAHSPNGSTNQLSLVEVDAFDTPGRRGLDRVDSAQLPAPPAAARTHGDGPSTPRPMHLMRVPSFLPPPFDADEPPPPAVFANSLDGMSPPPNYDMIVGTPSVDGLADYFARLADYEDADLGVVALGPLLATHEARESEPEAGSPDTINGDAAHTPTQQVPGGDDFFSHGPRRGEDDDDEEDSDTPDTDPARPHSRGRVNVANPRTPGGRLVPSRSLEIERPVFTLDIGGVVRTNTARG